MQPNANDVSRRVFSHGVTARVLAWPARDVMAVQVDDRRTSPEPVQVNLRMLRRGCTGALLRAAQILGRDAGMQPVWREFLTNLAPLSTSADPDALKPENYQGPRVIGRVDALNLESQAGAECRLRNPWGAGAVTLRRDGGIRVLPA